MPKHYFLPITYQYIKEQLSNTPSLSGLLTHANLTYVESLSKIQEAYHEANQPFSLEFTLPRDITDSLSTKIAGILLQFYSEAFKGDKNKPEHPAKIRSELFCLLQPYHNIWLAFSEMQQVSKLPQTLFTTEKSLLKSITECDPALTECKPL